MNLLRRVGVANRPGPRIRAASFVCLAVVLLLSAANGLAQPAAPPPPSTFFSDSTGTVPADAATQIEQRLREFEKSTSNQVLVVVGDRLPEGFTSLEEYTNRTAEAWRVGDKSRDNGAVLFVFVADRKVRIEVGYGLEGALPDALAARIISDEITPEFRQGRYGEGLLKGVEAIIAATKGEYQPAVLSPAPTLLFVFLVLFFLFFGLVLPMLREAQSISGSRTYSGGGRSRGRSSWGSSSGWGGGGGGGSSWGGGGGFSGGGGSFGGGGASGSW